MKISDLIIDIRHLGVYVEDMDTAVKLYKKIYDIDDTDIRYFPPLEEKNPESRFAFLPVGNMEFELIQPISERFKKIVGNPPAGFNHVAYTVTDIDTAVSLMQQKGIRLGHVTRNGILDMTRSRVAYFDPEDTGGLLIEFVEPRTQPPEAG